VQDEKQRKPSPIIRAIIRFQEWYRERAIRRVVVIAFLVALVGMILSRFDAIEEFAFYIAILAVVIALVASTIDTKRTLKEFNQGIKEVERNHHIREVETYGELTEPCFDEKDAKEIKRKRRALKGFMFMKIFFVIILVVLFIRNSIDL